ncbi:unnamed protein product [Jaminaea pallidilutea]
MSTTPMNTTTSHTNTAADNAQPRDWIEVLPGKTVSKYADPCAHAAKASMKCLETNQYDRSKCTQAFEDYRECKKAWITQRREDRLARRQGSWD